MSPTFFFNHFMSEDNHPSFQYLVLMGGEIERLCECVCVFVEVEGGGGGGGGGLGDIR